MPQFIRRMLFVTFLISTFVSCEKDEIAPPNPVTDISLNYNSMELQIIDLISDYRYQKGLSELNCFNLVSKEAETHTDYMIEKSEVSHDYFNARVENLIADVQAKSVAENVGYGYATAESLVNAWLESSSHLLNIESTSYTDFGISAKTNSEGNYYVTHIFINRQ